MKITPFKCYICDYYQGCSPDVVLVIRTFKQEFLWEGQVQMVEHIQVAPTYLRRTTIERASYFKQVYRPCPKLKRILYED